jgi:hypothetical protein
VKGTVRGTHTDPPNCWQADRQLYSCCVRACPTSGPTWPPSVAKFAVFLLILIVGYLIAKAIAKILSKVLTRVGFDRLVERGGVKRALDRSSYDASGILAKVVYYAIMLFVLSTAFGVFGSNPISDYLRAVIGYLPLAFVAIVVIAAIAAGTRNLIENSLGGLSYARVLANLVHARPGN